MNGFQLRAKSWVECRKCGRPIDSTDTVCVICAESGAPERSDRPEEAA